MGNVFKVWSRPVNLLTKVEGKGKLLRYDQDGFSDKPAEFEGD